MVRVLDALEVEHGEIDLDTNGTDFDIYHTLRKPVLNKLK